jgi:hypothetical protein
MADNRQQLISILKNEAIARNSERKSSVFLIPILKTRKTKRGWMVSCKNQLDHADCYMKRMVEYGYITDTVFDWYTSKRDDVCGIEPRACFAVSAAQIVSQWLTSNKNIGSMKDTNHTDVTSMSLTTGDTTVRVRIGLDVARNAWKALRDSPKIGHKHDVTFANHLAAYLVYCYLFSWTASFVPRRGNKTFLKHLKGLWKEEAYKICGEIGMTAEETHRAFSNGNAYKFYNFLRERKIKSMEEESPIHATIIHVVRIACCDGIYLQLIDYSSCPSCCGSKFVD